MRDDPDQRGQLERVTGPVSRETFAKLCLFEALFRKWAGKINLAAPSTLSQIWNRHILDSAQLLALAPHARSWLDLGSGGGFPGVVLAILLAERSGTRIHLVESNQKKAAFLQLALGECNVSASVLRRRIEDVGELVERPDVVSARALAHLPALLTLSSPWLLTGSTGLFHKGRDYRAEIEESRNAWRFDLVEHGSVVEDDSVILQIANLSTTGESRPSRGK